MNNEGLELREDFLRLIQGKRVALVGPAPYLIGRRLGNYINEFDVICRPNCLTPIAREEDYGSRTDIIFHNCGNIYIQYLRERIDKNPRDYDKVKMVVCPSAKVEAHERPWEYSDDIITQNVYNFQKINHEKKPFYWIGIRNYKKIYYKIGGSQGFEYTTGPGALETILGASPSTVFLTGITLFRDGNKYSTRQMYFPECKSEKYLANRGCDVHGNAPVPWGHHDPRNSESRYLKEVCRNFPDFQVDSYTNKLLQLGHNNVYLV